MIILNEENFEQEVLKARLPVLVDFYSDFCLPCKMVAPVLEELEKEYEGKIRFGKLDVEENPQTAAKYGVMSIPTVVLFTKGKEVGRIVGFTGKEGYKKYIDSILKIPEVPF